MNIETVKFDLGEALIHLESLVAEVRGGQIKNDDEPALAVQLGHILDHISRAWNCKDMSLEEWSKLSREESERLSNTVPNFLGQRVLGEFALG
jgi:hypothetical protein